MSEPDNAATPQGKPAEKHTVIRSRDGEYLRIPLADLPDFVLPSGTVVIQWVPGRYLAIPPERLAEYRMADADLVQVAMDPATGRRMRPPGRRATGSPRPRRGL